MQHAYLPPEGDVLSGSDSGSDSGSGSDDESVDERMVALERWKEHSRLRIDTLTRPPAPLLASAPAPSVSAIPLELRANDVKRHIINVDSQFREDPVGMTSTNFYYRMLTPIKNVLRMRLVSMEFPNNYMVFTIARKNISFLLINTITNISYPIVIPQGNYNAYEMLAVINTALSTALQGVGGWLKAAFNPNTGAYTFTASTIGQKFSIDFTYQTFNRPFQYGLGFNLGFSRNVLAATLDVNGRYALTSTGFATFAGDTYVFLNINDYAAVRQTINIVPAAPSVDVDQYEVVGLAKVVIREPKNYVNYDDGSTQHYREIVFQTPQDISRLKVQVLDGYGVPVELGQAQFSCALELIEIVNQSLFDTVRDSITLQYVT